MSKTYKETHCLWGDKDSPGTVANRGFKNIVFGPRAFEHVSEFEYCTFQNCKFPKEVEFTWFKGCRILNCDLSSVKLYVVRFEGSDLSRVNMDAAIWEDVLLVRTSVLASSFKRSSMSQVYIHGPGDAFYRCIFKRMHTFEVSVGKAVFEQCVFSWIKDCRIFNRNSASFIDCEFVSTRPEFLKLRKRVLMDRSTRDRLSKSNRRHLYDII